MVRAYLLPRTYVASLVELYELTATISCDLIAFNTAVALAGHDNERDGRGLILMHPKHVEQVVKMSSAFRQYLTETHGMDQDTRAKAMQLR